MAATNPYDVPSSAAHGQYGSFTVRNLHIKKIDVLSAAKMLGAFYALIGLVVGLFLSLIAVLGMAVGGDAAIGGIVTGVGAIILLPLFYGLGGFIGGVIGAFLYNVVASMVGGIIFEVEG